MGDLAAQIAAVQRGGAHPKHTVFVARGTDVITRECGTIITRSKAVADFFRDAPVITDDDIAKLLGYPQTKTAALASGNCAMVQTLDPAGNVIMESVVSVPNIQAVAEEYRKYGSIHVAHPVVVGLRRLKAAMGV